MEDDQLKNINTNTDELIFEFIQEVFLGIEKKNYSTLKEKENFDEILKTRSGMFMGINYLEVYLDLLYKNLVKKDDEFIFNKFKDIGSNLDINPVLSLNIITNVIMRVYPLFTRSKLRTDNECVYLECVKDVTRTMRKYIIQVFNEDLKKLREEKMKKKVDIDD